MRSAQQPLPQPKPGSSLIALPLPEPVAAVVLATKGVAHLLQDTRFCIRAVNSLFRARPPPGDEWDGALSLPSLRVGLVLPSNLTLFGAVVDGILGPRGIPHSIGSGLGHETAATISSPISSASEGLVFAICWQAYIIPDLALPLSELDRLLSSPPVRGPVSGTPAEPPRAVLEFPIHWTPPAPEGQPQPSRPGRIAMPLANTLFEFGKPHVMTLAHWRFGMDWDWTRFPSRKMWASPNSQWQPALEKVVVRLGSHSGPVRRLATERRDGPESVPRPAGDMNKSAALSMRVPLQPLTRPRRVVAGLGNVVRRISGPDGEPMPASRELEAAVHRLLADKSMEERIAAAAVLDEPPVVVWALLVPGVVMSHAVREWGFDDPDAIVEGEDAKEKPGAMGYAPGQGSSAGGEETKASNGRFGISSAMLPRLLALGCQLRRICRFSYHRIIQRTTCRLYHD